MSQRRAHRAEFKARVAPEAVKGLKTINEIAREYEAHPVQVSQWKKDLVERLPEVFGRAAGAECERLVADGWMGKISLEDPTAEARRCRDLLRLKGQSGDYEHRPGLSVHFRGMNRAGGNRRDADQQGRQRPLAGQHRHGAVLVGAEA